MTQEKRDQLVAEGKMLPDGRRVSELNNPPPTDADAQATPEPVVAEAVDPSQEG